jgi:hypothetical protein
VRLMEADKVSIPSCLGAKVCPNCAYSFEGLAEGGVCPECGRSRELGEIVLYGWGRGQLENVATTKRSRILWVGFLSVLWILFQSFQYFFYQRRWLLLWWLPVVVTWVWAYFSRRETRHPGQVQVRLSEAGCVQYPNTPGRNILGQMLSAFGWILPVVIAIGVTVGFAEGTIGGVWFWISVPVLVGISIPWWGNNRRFRREFGKLREGSLVDAHEVYQKGTPWWKFNEATMKPATEGNYRLQMSATKFVTSYPVDAEVMCTEEQAEIVRAYIRTRMARGKRAKDLELAKAKEKPSGEKGTVSGVAESR